MYQRQLSKEGLQQVHQSLRGGRVEGDGEGGATQRPNPCSAHHLHTCTPLPLPAHRCCCSVLPSRPAHTCMHACPANPTARPQVVDAKAGGKQAGPT